MLNSIYSIKERTQKETIAKIKQVLADSDLPTLEGSYRDKKYITLYLIEKNHSKFHIFGVFEPKVTKLSGQDGIITEIYFDFAKSEYWVKRNLKKVQFSKRNIDATLNQFSRSTLFRFVQPDNLEENYLEQMYYLSKNANFYINRKSHIKGVKYSLSEFFVEISGKFRAFEILAKAGLYDLAKNYEVYELNFSKTKPHQILKLSRKLLNLFSQHQHLLINDSHKDYSSFLRDYGSLDAKTKQEFDSHVEFIYSLGMKYGFLDFRDITTVFSTSNFIGSSNYWYYRSRQFRALVEVYNYDIRALLEYLVFKTKVEQGFDSARGASEYLYDYVRMSDEMSADYERYPSSLKLVHDIASRNYKVNISEIEKNKWTKLANKHSEYNWTKSNADYVIIYPQEPKDLIKEGNSLSHCVASYVRNVLNETTNIVFLREKETPDESLYTIEIARDSIVQARGRFNERISGKAAEFLKEFAKEFDLKLAY